MPEVSVVLPAAEVADDAQDHRFREPSGSSAALVPELHGLGAAADLQLVEQVAQVELHRVDRDAEIAGELGVGAPAAELGQQLALARAQRVRADRRGSR